MTKNEIIDIFESSTRIDRFVFWKTEDEDFYPPIASFERSFFSVIDPKFENDVIEFLAKISLTHTIEDIQAYVIKSLKRKEIDITLSYNVTDTNIDWEVLDAILSNIKDK